MRNLLCCLLLTSAVAFAQSASDNAAAERLKERVLRMNLLNPPTPPKAGPRQVILSGPVTPKVCAVPLLEMKPPGTADRMHTVSPRTPVRSGDTVQPPAPPCGTATFTNPK